MAWHGAARHGMARHILFPGVAWRGLPARVLFCSTSCMAPPAAESGRVNAAAAAVGASHPPPPQRTESPPGPLPRQIAGHEQRGVLGRLAMPGAAGGRHVEGGLQGPADSQTRLRVSAEFVWGAASFHGASPWKSSWSGVTHTPSPQQDRRKPCYSSL